MEDKILIIGYIEDITKDGEVVGKKVSDSTGDSLNVKGGGKGMPLKARWDELQIGRAYSFTMGEYKPPDKPGESYPYVKDFKSVKDPLVIEAQKKVETKTTDSLNKRSALTHATEYLVGMVQAKPELAAQFKSLEGGAEMIAKIAKKHFEPYLNNDHIVAEAIKEGAEIS